MTIVPATKAHFDEIVTHIAEFWGSDRTLHIHQPIVIFEFGNTGYVIEDQGKVAAYLFGFFSQTEPAGYINLIAVRDTHRGLGLGRRLYEHFMQVAVAHSCTRLKAITSPSNSASIGFHQRLGMTLAGEPNAEGIPVVKDYSGPGRDMVVFGMKIADYQRPSDDDQGFSFP